MWNPAEKPGERPPGKHFAVAHPIPDERVAFPEARPELCAAEDNGRHGALG